MTCAHPFTRFCKTTNQSYVCPCGWCIPCRINKRRSWESRITMEQSTRSLEGSTALFCTFTYADKFLPKAGVSHRDVRNFIKLVRERSYRKECARMYLADKDIRKKYGSITKFERSRTIERPKLSFFLASEYGGKLGRAHYHAIIFIQPRYSRYLRECWRNGFSDIKPLRAGGIRYVLKYMDKQQSPNHIGDDLYRKAGLEPPFCVKSQGLGKEFILAHLDEIRNDGGVRMRGRIIPVPRHYCDKFDIDCSVPFDPSIKDKYKRARTQEKSEMQKMRSKLEPFFDYYHDKRFAFSTMVDEWHFPVHQDLINQIIKEISA